LVEFIAIYNCVSSAYWAWLTPNDSIMPAIGATYMVVRSLAKIIFVRLIL
jgi:hypothetical protein